MEEGACSEVSVCKQGVTCLTMRGTELAKSSPTEHTCVILQTGECRIESLGCALELATSTRYCQNPGDPQCRDMGYDKNMARILSDGSCMITEGKWSFCAVYDKDKGNYQFCKNGVPPSLGVCTQQM